MDENMVEVVETTASVATEVADKTSGLTKFVNSVPGKITMTGLLIGTGIALKVGYDKFMAPKMPWNKPKEITDAGQAAKDEFKDSKPTKK